MTPSSGRRIELWVEPRGGVAAVNPVMRGLLDTLERDGAAVAVRVLEHEVVDVRRSREGLPPDLVLLKSATTLALSVAVAMEESGAIFLNGARATLRAHDKAATVARLAAEGLPVPETFLFQPGTDGEVPRSGDARGGWVTKPIRGVHGLGVAAHPGFPSTLNANGTHLVQGKSYVVDDGVRLVQRKIGGSEIDTKVYVANGRCFAGSKAFGPDSYARDDIEPVVLDRAVEEAVLAAGEALGLRLFGVDLRFDGDEAFIIDANPFPGYRGFPEAVLALRAEIERALEDLR